MALALLLISARYWVDHIGYGFAYGAWVGVPGKESALQETGALGLRALRRAVALEGIGIALCLWLFFSLQTPFRVASRFLRVAVSLFAAAWFTFFTFALIHGAW